MSNINASAGVDYAKIIGFKRAMCRVAEMTRALPKNIAVLQTVNGHAGAYHYTGQHSHFWVTTHEGLGNKAWISMMLNRLGIKDPTGEYWFGGIGIDTFLMGANDNAAQGGRPVIVTDEVSCGSDEFFETPQPTALSKSFEQACLMGKCALVHGESPAYKYLMKAEPPVEYAPSLSVNVVGIVEPTVNFISGGHVRRHDIIIGTRASGLHANGISPVIKAVMALPNGFETECNGRTIGEEALIPTRSYLGFVNALLLAGIDIHAFLPMTGGGIAKFAADTRYHYKIDNWVPYDEMPALFRFMRQVCGLSIMDIIQTFNCGIGYAVIVPPCEVDKVLSVGSKTPIDGAEGLYNPIVLGTVVGTVKKIKARVDFSSWNMRLSLPPPG